MKKKATWKAWKEPTKKQQRWLISDDVYQSDINLFVGGTIEQATMWLNKRYDMNMERRSPTTFTYACIIVNPAFKGCGMWFKFPSPPASAVAHEIFHAAHHILGGSGLSLTDESEEAYAYYIDWLTKEIGDRVWK